MFAALFPLVVQAAEVTEIPPAFRADLEVRYDGSFDFVSLDEADQTVGRGTRFRHDINLRTEFSPLTGIAVGLQFPITAAWAMNWSESKQMTFDPTTGSGTYLNAEPTETNDGWKASGLQGVWLTAAFAPFSQSYGKEGLKQTVDWRLDVAYRTGSKNVLWTNTDGKRGAAMGGGAWRLGAAFSTTRGASSPYLAMNAVLEGKAVDFDIVDDNGTTWAQGLPVDPPSTIDIVGGTEILSAQNQDIGYRFVVDMYVGFGYVSWGDVPSGLYLPSVLDVSREIPVTTSEYLRVKGGLATTVDFNKYIGMRLGAEGQYYTPHRLEHPYAVRTGLDTFGVNVTAELEGRIR